MSFLRISDRKEAWSNKHHLQDFIFLMPLKISLNMGIIFSLEEGDKSATVLEHNNGFNC